MKFIHMLADETDIYAATEDGHLLWYRDTLRNGLNGPLALNGWAYGSGRNIGAGWGGFRHLFAGGQGILYAITDDGRLLWYRDMARNGEAGWHSNSGRQIGFGWTGFDHVFADGSGVIYAVTAGGALRWYRDDLRDGSNGEAAENGWAALSGSQIGVGWAGFRSVFAGGNGVIYAVREAGALLWYRDLLRDGSNGPGAELGWDPASGSQIGFGWQGFARVFGSPAADGVIYAVTPASEMLWYADRLRNGGNGPDAAFGWDPASGGQIGSGWTIAPRTPPLQAYPVPASLAPGDSVALKLRADRPTDCTVTLLRLRENADGSVGVPVAGPFPVQAATVNAGPRPWQTGCAWEDALTVATDAAWPSGIYAFRCEAPGNRAAEAVFVLRPGPVRRRFLVLANTNCWNAYNDWGGTSNYTGAGVVTLSFERPNPAAAASARVGGHYEANHLTAAEIWLLTWLEDAGYAADVCSDLDFHRGEPDPSGYDAVILSTHPEYWSQAMAQRLQSYIASGGKLVYLGGNGIFRTVDFAPDGRAMTTGDASSWYCGNAWAAGPKPRSLLGVAYDIAHDAVYPSRCGYVVLGADHLVFAGTGVANGDVMGALGRNGGGACGWEVDTAFDFLEGNGPAPAGLRILARGENAGTPSGYTGHMTWYDTPAGGFVFAIGSITFGGSLMVDPVLQQVLRNALAACAA